MGVSSSWKEQSKLSEIAGEIASNSFNERVMQVRRTSSWVGMISVDKILSNTSETVLSILFRLTELLQLLLQLACYLLSSADLFPSIFD